MAERVWLGTATDVKQITTCTVGGTWAGTEVAVLSINGAELSVTLGTGAGTTAVATALSNAINASTETANLQSDETRTSGGQQIPEFTEVVASVSGSVVTVTSRVAGVPFTLAKDDSGSTSGTLTLNTTQDATGSEHWDNTANWSGGAVPVNSDDVVIDGRAASSIRYGIDQNAVTLSSLTITRGFASPLQIGNAQVRETTAGDYAEYREDELKISATNVNIGSGSGTMSGLIRLNFGSAATTVIVYATGSRDEDNVPAINLVGTNASNAIYTMPGTDVGIAFFDNQAATVATLETSGRTYVGDGGSLTTVDVNAGSYTSLSACTTLSISGGVVDQVEGAVTTANVYRDGELVYRSTGTVTTMTVAGTLTCPDPRGRTITNELNLLPGAKVSDPFGSLTLSNGFTVDTGKLDDVDIDFGYDRSYTVS